MKKIKEGQMRYLIGYKDRAYTNTIFSKNIVKDLTPMPVILTSTWTLKQAKTRMRRNLNDNFTRVIYKLVPVKTIKRGER